jgi:spore germination cell wall hydrolase CwlJ-like protein
VKTGRLRAISRGLDSGRIRRCTPVGCFVIVVCLAASLAPPSATAGEEAKKEAARSKAAAEEKAAARGVEAPPAAPITRGEAQAVDQSGKEPLDNAITCLARTIYWEARDSTAADMEAIASVVMNRVGHEGFPGTVCGVVKEGEEQKACQFSWWCDGLPDTAQNEKSYGVAKEIARKALNRQLTDLAHGALYFHNKGSTPAWAKQYIETAAIGGHVFYKPRGGKAK